MDLFILDEIDLHEISGVDDPAQPTAKATIIKRNNQTPDIPALVQKTNEEQMSEKVTDIEKALAEKTEALAELTKSVSEVEAKSAKAFAEIDAIMSMSNIEFETFKAVDGDKKKELLALDEKERKKKLAKEASEEEVVKFEGTDIRKSAVGNEQFLLFKKLADMELEVAKTKDAEHMVRLEKRAADEFSHLAGTATEIAAVLKAMETMPESAKVTLEAIMKSAAEANVTNFVKKGSDKAVEEAELKKSNRDDKIAEIMKSKGISKHKAMEIAATSNPELF